MIETNRELLTLPSASSHAWEPREFFALYDYGEGGLWVILAARSADDIRNRYPMLHVFNGDPPMLDPALIAAIRRAGVQQIDAPPTGWLAELASE